MTAVHLQPCQEHRVGWRRGAAHAAVEALDDTRNWLLAALSQWRRRSRERAQLAALNDRQLSDIGLTRADAEILINKPFWRE